MKRLFVSFAVMLAPALAGATSPGYTNNGTIYAPFYQPLPQIDAINFVNNGSFTVFTTDPFQFSNTKNFLNRSRMTGDTGFEFDTWSTSLNGPYRANSFTNLGSTTASNASVIATTKLLVDADTIMSRGLLQVGGAGLLKLSGANVDLGRSALQVLGFSSADAFVAGNWGNTNNGVDDLLVPARNLSTSSPVGPAVLLTNLNPFPFFGFPYLSEYKTWPYQPGVDPNLVETQFIVSKDNVLVAAAQVVYLANANTNITADIVGVGDTNSGIPLTLQIRFGARATNIFGQVFTNYLYLSDTFGRTQYATSNSMSKFIGSFGGTLGKPTYGPRNYTLSRTAPADFPADLSAANFGEPYEGPDLFATFYGLRPDGTTSNFNIIGWQVALTNISQPPVSPQTIPELPGRMEISADKVLDLRFARLQGQNYIKLEATNHFIGNTNASFTAMSAPYCDLNLASTNGQLVMANLMQPTVPNLLGTVDLCSLQWTNLQFVPSNSYSFTAYARTDTNSGEVIVGPNPCQPETNCTARFTATYIHDNGVQDRLRCGSLEAFLVYGPETNCDGPIFVATYTHDNGDVNQIPCSEPPYGEPNCVATNIFVAIPAQTNAVKYSVLMVDARLTTDSRPTILNLNLRSTNVAIGDTYNVAESMLIDATTLTIQTNGAINYSGTDYTWTDQLPYLRSFTNSSTLSNPNGNGFFFISHNRADYSERPYDNFINLSPGRILATGGMVANARNFFSSGLIEAYFGSIDIQSTNLVLTAGGSLTADSSDISLTTGTLNISNTITAAHSLNLTVTNALKAGSGDWSVGEGFNLLVKPATGDLSAITVYSTAFPYANPISTWAGADRGTNTAGFTNNAALGRLILDGGANSLFTFQPATTGSNALYVDRLDLTNSAILYVAPNMTIYFSKAYSNDVPVSAADLISGGSIGNFVQVNHVGLFSLVKFGPGNLKLNVSLSAGGGAQLNSLSGGPTAATISWNSVANAGNTVYYKNHLGDTTWQVLTNFASGPADGLLTVTDTAQAGGRFYRVRVDPPSP